MLLDSQQMTAYFNQIKQSYLQKSLRPQPVSVHSIDPGSGQAELITLYDKMLLNFNGERKKYVTKIEELLSFIISLESKNQENA